MGLILPPTRDRPISQVFRPRGRCQHTRNGSSHKKVSNTALKGWHTKLRSRPACSRAAEMSHLHRRSSHSFQSIEKSSLCSISSISKTCVYWGLRHPDNASPIMAWHFLLRLTAFFFQPRPMLGLTCNMKRGNYQSIHLNYFLTS
jgi:hypothetical protein